MKIEFIAGDAHVSQVREKPLPASQFIPDWWKNMPPFSKGDSKLKIRPYSNVTAKKCFPLLDGMTAGYIVTLWADLLVENENGFSKVQWTTEADILSAWDGYQTEGFEIPENFCFPVYKYFHGWSIKTPAGYSCLITHPVAYPNLPIKTLTGVVDTDTFDGFANSPFVIQKGFEGIIEKGTPMFQIIPFKRDEWEAVYKERTPEQTFMIQERFYSKIQASYGRGYRSKKSFS